MSPTMQKLGLILSCLLLTQGALAQNPCSKSSYSQALCMSFLFYEAERSGSLPDDQRVTFRQDSALDDGSDNGVDLEGGYYDAGDHVKFGLPMAYTITVLSWGVIAFEEGYTTAGEIENARTAIRWGTDYLEKCHTGTNELYGQVGDGDLDHSFWGRPEDMTMERPSAKITTSAPGSELAGETAAALAAASIALGDSSLLASARELYEFANNYRLTYTDSIPGASGFYTSYSGYGDELAWAAAWLYKATGESEYRTAADSLIDEFGILYYLEGFGWDNKNPGVITLMADLTGDQVYTDALAEYTNKMINEHTKTPGGLIYFDQWGSLRNAANVAFLNLIAAQTGDKADENIAFAQSQADYMLGSNPLSHSYVIGYGSSYSVRPHHRSSSCPDIPEPCDSSDFDSPDPNPQTLYGALVGGPDNSDNYEDDRSDYVQNEVACDYNAAFSGLMAGLVQLA